jgi:hypothetical protein
MNDAPKTPGDSLASVATGKAGLEGLQMTQNRPENPFRKAGVTFLVGVGEIIATGRRRTAQRYQQPVVKPQAVADVVESDGMGELGVDQTH